MNVLVTGASRGLGREIARQFLDHGADVAAVARGVDGIAGAIAADLGECGAPEKIVERLRSRWDHIDVLVNNAAIIGPIGPLWENDPAEWERTLRVNLLAPVELCRLCIPWMPEGGAIINISGGGATGPRPCFTAYGTAKAGLVRFTETLAHEVEERGIRVNSVAPGAMNTEMLEAVIRAGPDASGEYEGAVQRKMAGEHTVAKAAAELVCWLASHESRGVTGRLISSVWDNWHGLVDRARVLTSSDIYTLRRIVPEDRGKLWA